MSVVTLQTDAGNFQGWEQISIKRSLEQLANTFRFSVSDAGIKKLSKHPLQLDAACRVLIDDTPMLNGFVEELNPTIGDTEHALSVAGRDITGDLVDCSAMIPNQELHNVTLAEAATALCNDYQVKIHCPEPGKVFEKWAVNDGETIFSSLESHARQRGQLLYTLGDSILRIEKPTAIDIDAALIEGDNILHASATHKTKQRFHHYLVKSQKAGKNSENSEFTDTGVRSPRRRITRAEKPVLSADCANRAEWEARLRAAQGRRATITVQGWYWKPNKLWDLRQTLPVRSPRLDLDERMMVVDVEYLTGNDGSTTRLQLVPPTVYSYA